MNFETNPLYGKREQFRIQIRRDFHEDHFAEKRKYHIRQLDDQIKIPKYQDTKQLHQYLIEGDDEELINRKLQALIQNTEYLNEILELANTFDYYALLIMCNLSHQQYIKNVDIVFINCLKQGLSQNNLKIIINCLHGLENLLANPIEIEQLLHLNQLDFLNQTMKVCQEIRNNNSIYNQQEIDLLNTTIRVIMNYIIQYRSKDQVKEFEEFQQNSQLIVLFNFCQSLIRLHLQDACNKCKCLNLIIQLLRVNENLLSHIENKTIEAIIKFLSLNDNSLVITSLKFMIVISSIDNEVYMQRVLVQGGVDDIKQLIHNESQLIRNLSYHALSNFASAKTKSIQKCMASDNQFFLEIVNSLKNLDCNKIDTIYLLYGLIVNCHEFMHDETVQDSFVIQYLQNIFVTFDDKLDIEIILLTIKMLVCLILSYRIFINERKAKQKIKDYCYHENKKISEYSQMLLAELEKN